MSGRHADALLAILFIALAAGAAAAWISLGSLWLAAIPAAGAVLLAYAALIEPRWLTVTRQAIRFPLSKPLRIAVVADFHIGPFKGSKWIDHVVQKINSLKPDLVLIPGDFLFDPLHDIAPLEPLKGLKAPLGVFAVPGNHDAGQLSHFGKAVDVPDRSDDLEKFLAPLGVRMLRNESVTLSNGDERFAVAGIDDLWSETCDIKGALKGLPEELPVILLTHHPDTILEQASHRADLIVCGHTHGGQVCWPGGRPAIGIPSEVSAKYAHGSHAVGKRATLFVTRGCGETMLRVRFWCRPEIALLEISGQG